MKKIWKVLLCVAIIASMLLTSVFAATAADYPSIDVEPIGNSAINIGDVENARDIGGWTTEDGYTIKTEMLFRSGHLQNADAQLIKKLGITTIIDLRTKLEAARKPDVSVEDVNAVSISLLTIPNLFVMESEDWKTLLSAITRGIMETWDANLYRQYIQDPNAIEGTREFFDTILASNGGKVLWHCTAGKDRTGIEAMLLMAALGCKYEDIQKEFLKTNEFYQEKAEASYDKAYKLTHIKAIAREFYNYEIVKKEWLEISMDVMMRMTGTSNADDALDAYLANEIGLEDEDLAALRYAYLDDYPLPATGTD